MTRGFCAKYRSWSRALDDDEVLQVTRVAVYTALQRWDPSRGTKFSTWAYLWIRKEVQRTLEETRGEAVSHSEDDYTIDCVAAASWGERSAVLESTAESINKALLEAGLPVRDELVIRAAYGIDAPPWWPVGLRTSAARRR